jgi:diguanylate cyclase (GGDEF)-like protein/PAS domain S-box-containing protein
MTEQKPRILAIDDTPANLATLGAALASEFDLQTAISGAMGLALAKESPPDLILLDVMMPEMDGYETCRRLKAEPGLKNVPVIFVTALSEIAAEEHGLSLGAADYITKPINVAISRQRIRNLLQREQIRKELESQRDLLKDQVTQCKQVEKKLCESEEKYRSLVETAHELVWKCDKDGRLTYVNPAWQDTHGYQAEEMLGKHFGAFQRPEVFERDRMEFARHGAGASIKEYETTHLAKNGMALTLLLNVVPLRNQAGEIIGTQGTAIDITERKRTEKKLQLAASVFSTALEGIMITEADGTIIKVNEAFTRITGYSPEEAVGRNPRFLSAGHQSPESYAAMWSDLQEKGHWRGETWNRRNNGEVYAEMQSISSVPDPDGQSVHYVSLFSDITSVKDYQHQLERLAHFDVLTGLPNRVLLADRLRQAMTRAQRQETLLAVVFLDLDGFKAINDNHGHQAGDQLLISLAARLKAGLRESDTLARIGGDEFVAVLVDLGSAEDCIPMLKRILAAAADPVSFGDSPLQVSASLGVTFYPQQEEIDADQLQHQADQAMYQAKSHGKNRYHRFDATQKCPG